MCACVCMSASDSALLAVKENAHSSYLEVIQQNKTVTKFSLEQPCYFENNVFYTLSLSLSHTHTTQNVYHCMKTDFSITLNIRLNWRRRSSHILPFVNLSPGRKQQHSLMDTIEVLVPWNKKNFLIIWNAFPFLKRLLLHWYGRGIFHNHSIPNE